MESPQSRQVRDSIYKDDSLLAVYVMEKLKSINHDSTASESIKKQPLIIFPTLSPDLRKVKPIQNTDSCEEDNMVQILPKSDSIVKGKLPKVAVSPPIPTKPKPKDNVKSSNPSVPSIKESPKIEEKKTEVLPSSSEAKKEETERPVSDPK